MQDLILHAGKVLLASEYVDDAEQAATIALVRLKEKISAVEGLALSLSGKKMTDKRREAVNELLASVLFYTAVLVYLNKIPEETFDQDQLQEFAEGLHLDYQVDPLLCANQMMGFAAQIMEEMFDTRIDEGHQEGDMAPPASLVTPEGALINSGVNLDKIANQVATQVVKALEGEEAAEDFSEEAASFDGENSSEIEHAIACVFAGAMILAQIFDTDFGVIVYNATTKEVI